MASNQTRIDLALDFIEDGENRDEMSSDAQEWCDEIACILRGGKP